MADQHQQLHLLHLFATFAAGGPQVRTATLIHALPDRFRHTIVGLDGNFACRERLEGHPRVAFAEPPRKSRLGGYAVRLARLIRRVRPDLVLTYNWGAIEAIPGARLAGVRRIIHGEDGFGPEEAERQLRRRVWFRRLVLPLAVRVVVPSHLLLGHVESTWRVPSRARILIPNGIDLEHYSPGRADELRRRWGVAPGDFVIGTVARLRAEKGLELLVQAFAQFARKVAAAAAPAVRPTVRLVVVGDGPEETKLRALVRELGVEAATTFAGPVADTRDCYRAFDLFALSSHTEQMPISLVEAMGCGLAAVATAVGDVARMVAPANGPFVLPGREPAALAEAFIRLAGDAALRAGIGAANRAKALGEYAVGTMVERYRELYEAVARES